MSSVSSTLDKRKYFTNIRFEFSMKKNLNPRHEGNPSCKPKNELNTFGAISEFSRLVNTECIDVHFASTKVKGFGCLFGGAQANVPN